VPLLRDQRRCQPGLAVVARWRAAAEAGPETHRRGVEQEQLAGPITRRSCGASPTPATIA